MDKEREIIMKKGLSLVLALTIACSLSCTAFADGYYPLADEVSEETAVFSESEVSPKVAYLTLTYDDYASTDDVFTLDIVISYSEVNDWIQRVVSYDNLQSDYYKNLVITDKSYTLSNGNRTATFEIEYAGQLLMTNEMQHGTATFVLTVS